MNAKNNNPSKGNSSILELLISEEDILKKVTIVSHEIDAFYAGQSLVIIMIMKGAICLVADLIRKISIPCSLEFIQANSYGAFGEHRGELVIKGLDSLDIKGKNVLVVDDIFDSGITLSEVIFQLKKKEAKSLKSLVLLSKKIIRKTSYFPDHVLFAIEDRFVVGYGLDYKEQFRGLPGVFALSLENLVEIEKLIP